MIFFPTWFVCSISNWYTRTEKKILVCYSSWCCRSPRALNGVKKTSWNFCIFLWEQGHFIFVEPVCNSKKRVKNLFCLFPTILDISIDGTLWVKEPNFPASYEQLFKQKAIILTLVFLYCCTAGLHRENLAFCLQVATD